MVVNLLFVSVSSQCQPLLTNTTFDFNNVLVNVSKLSIVSLH